MSLQEDIYNKLRNAIIYGELSPGEKLSEIELAKRMNTSRTPIREAFRQLQTLGYIAVSPNKGAYVSKLSPEEIEEIYNIVSLLEGYAAELAAQRANISGLNELRRLQRKLIFLASKKKYFDYMKVNTTFHCLIAALSGNNNLNRIVSELRAHIYWYRLASVTVSGYLEKYASDHESIIDSIAKRDSIQARKYMKDHVNFVKKILVDFLKENPSFSNRI